MRRSTTWRRTPLALTIIAGVLLPLATGCSTAPKAEDRASFEQDAQTAMGYFERNVPGLRAQVQGSAGYVIFPAIGQYGVIIGGGKFGRGIVKRQDGTKVGWAYINRASAGLQLGAQGFKMLMVLEDQATMKLFQESRLTGSVNATMVAGQTGGSAVGSFDNGVVVYQGGRTGLMAGAAVGLDFIRFEPL